MRALSQLKLCWIILVVVFIFSCSVSDIRERILSEQTHVGTLEIRTIPEGASIMLDGILVGVAPLFLKDIPTGDHEIIIDLPPEYLRQEKRISIQPHQTKLLIVNMATSCGILNIQTNPSNAHIYLDGQSVGRSPKIIKCVSLGSHRVELSLEPYPTVVTEIQVDRQGLSLLVPLGGSLKVSTKPEDALITLDGSFVGITPLFLKSIPPGVHHIKAAKFLWLTQECIVFIVRGREKTVIMDIEPNHGTLAITSDPDGVEIYISEAFKGSTPKNIRVTPGTYHIVLKAEKHYQDFEQTITVQKGNQYSINHFFKEKVVNLSVTSEPTNAEVKLDGTPSGQTPLTLEKVKVGTHQIVLRKGHLGCLKNIEVNSKIEGKIHATLVPIHPPSESYVFVPAGTFPMGGKINTDAPLHNIILSDYWIGKYEVTVHDYKECVLEGGCSEPGEGTTCNWGKSGRQRHPINCVSWEDAMNYAAWISQKTGLCYQLPTEAQWEKSARGTKARTYPWGHEWDGKRANYCDRNCKWLWKDSAVDDGYAETAPVGHYEDGKSFFGLYDMAGNIREWCRDCYDPDYYFKKNLTDPSNTQENDKRVIRGGGWKSFKDQLHTDLRSKLLSNKKLGDVGFRLVFEGKEKF